MKKNLVRALAQAGLIAGVAALGGCGGGGGGGGGSEAPASSSVTVTPALGKFSNGAHVFIKKPDGTELGKGDISGGTGQVTINIGSYTGPILIEVKGDTGVTYYDEGVTNPNDRLRPFDSAAALQALAPAVQAQIGVTAATHAAVAAIKAKNGNSIPSGIVADDIRLANYKIGMALGINDVLLMPKPVDGTTNNLNLANPDEAYALKLAALAKLAMIGKSAYDAAQDIANDLKDDQLDGKYTPPAGAVVPNSSTTYDDTTIKTQYEAELTEAATELGDDDTKQLAPAMLGSVTTGPIQAPPTGTNLTDLQKAKAMFAELRTTLRSFYNGSTGFLDNQARNMGTDLNSVVAPSMTSMNDRLDVMDTGVFLHDNIKTGGSGLMTAAQTALQQWGGLSAYVPSYNMWVHVDGTTYRFETIRYYYSYYGGMYPSGNATCTSKAHTLTEWQAAVAGGNLPSGFYVDCSRTGTVSLIAGVPTQTDFSVRLSPQTGGSFQYYAWRTLTAYNGGAQPTVTYDGQSVDGSGNVTSSYAGTISTSPFGTQGGQASYAVNGTLPGSADGVAKESVTINYSRSHAGTTATYALTGNFVSQDANGNAMVTASFDPGTTATLTEDANGVRTTHSAQAGTIVGTVKTAKTKFTGTLTMDSFKVNADGQNFAPTRVVYTGSLSDISSGGAGEFLTGKLEANMADYQLYRSTLPESGSNFKKIGVVFTGTIQAPSRPLMKLVASMTKTGPTTGTMLLNYSYGTVSISGSGSFDDAGISSSNSWTLSNQDGIQWVHSKPLNGATTDQVSKSGAKLADIVNSAVHYVDGYSESLM